MITTIESVIKQLEEIKKIHGDIIVRVACQVQPSSVDFNIEVLETFNESKTVAFKLLIIKGYKDK